MTAKDFLEKLSERKSEDKLTNVDRFFKGDDGRTIALGVKFATVFKIAKEFSNIKIRVIEELLESDYYEVRMGAASIMDFKACDRKTSQTEKRRLFNLYLAHHDRLNNWDLVDRAAASVIGEYLFDKPRFILHKLAHSSDVWERRTSIVSTKAFIKRDHLDETFRISETLIKNQHESINRVIGTVLRRAGEKNEKKLKAFLDNHAHSMPRITLRYAVRKMDTESRQHYLSKKEKNNFL